MTAPLRRRAASRTSRKKKRRTFSLKQLSISCTERRSRQRKSWKTRRRQPRLNQRKCQIRLSQPTGPLYKRLLSQDKSLFLWLVQPEAKFKRSSELASDKLY